MVEFLTVLGVLGALLGALYPVLKARKYKEENLTVDRDWLHKRGRKEKYEKGGYRLRWVAADKVESCKDDGYEIVYKTDHKKRINYRLCKKDGYGNVSNILMRKLTNNKSL